MKKQLIAAIVGGLIIFIWQFLSWTMLHIHDTNQKYTANQDAIIEALGQNLSEDGTYFMPNVAPGTTQEEAQAARDNYMGEPWAIVSYHSAFEMNMGMSMFRALITNMLAVFLLSWVLMKIPDLDMMNTVLASLGVGFVGFLTVTYLSSIWYTANTLPELLDTVVQWGLCGVWLGWFLNRK
jgi:hypothetical protein